MAAEAEVASAGETCFMCSTIIREASGELEGEPALLCEGRHQRWAHARCVGVSDVLYEDIQTCGTPWVCPQCYSEAAKAVQNKPALQEEIQALKAENTGFKAELSELKALVSSLHAALSAVENRVTSVSSNVDLIQSAPAPASYSDIARQGATNRQRSGGQRRTGRQNTGQRSAPRSAGHQPPSNQTQGGSDTPTPAGGRALSPTLPGNESQRRDQDGSRSQRSQNRNEPQQQRQHRDRRQDNQEANSTERVQARGVRRIWGTMKSCSSSAVKNAITRLIPDQRIPGIAEVSVKRKFKRSSDNKLRWWFLIYMPEEALEKLESEWEPVALQTSWKLEPCMAPANFLHPAVESHPLT